MIVINLLLPTCRELLDQQDSVEHPGVVESLYVSPIILLYICKKSSLLFIYFIYCNMCHVDLCFTSLQGLPGPSGPVGPPGAQGERGTTGPQGTKGMQGDVVSTYAFTACAELSECTQSFGSSISHTQKKTAKNKFI